LLSRLGDGDWHDVAVPSASADFFEAEAVFPSLGAVFRLLLEVGPWVAGTASPEKLSAGAKWQRMPAERLWRPHSERGVADATLRVVLRRVNNKPGAVMRNAGEKQQ
jgi:hypothetical protein